MRKKLLAIILAFVLCAMTISVGASAPSLTEFSASSTGYKPGSAFKISSADSLAVLATRVNAGESFLGVIFILEADLTLTGAWTPIGATESTHFSGVFDGNGHTIRGLSVDTDAYAAGLFGTVLDGSVINLTLEGSVKGADHVGGIAGMLLSSDGVAAIRNCSVAVNVSGASNVGGVVGYRFGIALLQSCASSGTVTATGNYAGGIVGLSLISNGDGSGSVKSCFNTGAVSAKGYAGGIAGACISKSGTASITDSFSTGSVTGDTFTGGVVGMLDARDPGKTDVINCYYDQAGATGAINGADIADATGRPAADFTGDALTALLGNRTPIKTDASGNPVIEDNALNTDFVNKDRTPVEREDKADPTWIIAIVGVLLLIAVVFALYFLFRRMAEKKAAKAALEAPSAEETPAEEAPVEEAPAEEAPAEEAPAEEAPAEEAPAEEAPAEEAPAEEAPAPIAPVATAADGDEEDEEEQIVGYTASGKVLILRYRKGFQARLILAGEETKDYYSQLRNYIMHHEKTRGNVSWNYDTFFFGRTTVAKMNVRGKTLLLYLPLEPETLDSKYAVTDYSGRRRYAAVPAVFRVNGPRKLKLAFELLDMVFANLGMVATSEPDVDYVAANAPDTRENLIARGLIKVVTGERFLRKDELPAGTPEEKRTQIDAAEAHDLMTDEEAESLLETEPEEEAPAPAPAPTPAPESLEVTAEVIQPEESATAPEAAERERTEIINIDTISANFENGDVVTCATLVEKGLLPKKTTRVKVLARGVLNKALTVHAYQFSLDAVKMIVLTGGHAIQPKKK